MTRHYERTIQFVDDTDLISSKAACLLPDPKSGLSKLSISIQAFSVSTPFYHPTKPAMPAPAFAQPIANMYPLQIRLTCELTCAEEREVTIIEIIIFL